MNLDSQQKYRRYLETQIANAEAALPVWASLHNRELEHRCLNAKVFYADALKAFSLAVNEGGDGTSEAPERTPHE